MWRFCFGCLFFFFFFFFFFNYRFTLDVIDEEAIVNYYGPPTTSGGAFQSTAFAPYTGLKKSEKVSHLIRVSAVVVN